MCSMSLRGLWIFSCLLPSGKTQCSAFFLQMALFSVQSGERTRLCSSSTAKNCFSKYSDFLYLYFNVYILQLLPTFSWSKKKKPIQSSNTNYKKLVVWGGGGVKTFLPRKQCETIEAVRINVLDRSCDHLQLELQSLLFLKLALQRPGTEQSQHLGFLHYVSSQKRLKQSKENLKAKWSNYGSGHLQSPLPHYSIFREFCIYL